MDFVDKIRENRLELADLEGGTFTISNGGVYGSLLSTPILNTPQSGILGMHKIEKRPVVVDDEMVIRPMMYVALSYDHRIVDGREAVTCLKRIKECVENPERMHDGDLNMANQRTIRPDRHRLRPRRLCGCCACRPAGHEGGLHRKNAALRRGMPQRGLHSQQGSAGLQRILSPGQGALCRTRHQDRQGQPWTLTVMMATKGAGGAKTHRQRAQAAGRPQN